MNTSLAIKDKSIIEQIKNCYKRDNRNRDLLLFILGINTGLKLTDLLSLNIRDVKDKDFIELKDGIRFDLSEEVQNLIAEEIADKPIDAPLFESREKNRIDRTTVFVCFKNICNSLGLKGFSVNSWRKTFGYWYYEKYKDLYFLQWYFGHNSAKQTMDFIGVTESISNKFQQGVCL